MQSPSPKRTFVMEDPLEEPSEKKPMKKIEAIVVRLFQDENASGPRKPGEEYVHSLLNKDGYVISHEYRREKISPDDPPPTKKEDRPATDRQGKECPNFPPGASKEEKLLIHLKDRQLENERMRASLEDKKRDIKALHEKFSFFYNNLDARISFLARAVGGLDDLDENSSDDYPYFLLVLVGRQD